MAGKADNDQPRAALAFVTSRPPFKWIWHPREDHTMQNNLALNLAVAVTAAAACLSIGSTAQAAGPEIVSGPSESPNCYVPWTKDTKFFKFPEKKGPYRIALANGYIANTWRIQMIQTAKAYAAQPEVAKNLKEFKVVSTGEDVAAQISAINNFIDSGFDAIVVNAQNPKAFTTMIKRSKAAGVILVSFDNIRDPTAAIKVKLEQ